MRLTYYALDNFFFFQLFKIKIEINLKLEIPIYFYRINYINYTRVYNG